MVDSQAIFKLGGKILENHLNLTATISQLTSLYERGILHKVILIAGGGSYANLIRLLDQKIHIGNDISHWMAIYTMDLNGKKISRYFPRIMKTNEIEEIERNSRIFTVFLPYKYLHQHDILPHSWEVTSDSITVYLAYKLNFKNCFLIKDVDGIYNHKNQVIKSLTSKEFLELKNTGGLATYKSSNDNIKYSKPVDSYLPKLVNKFKVSCVILNGSCSNLRILKYFKIESAQKKVYTQISYN